MRYKKLVLAKSGMSKRVYAELLTHLLDYITLVSEENTIKKLKEASEILGKVNPNDVVFLSTALNIENSSIWSDDSHFEKQDKVKVFKTRGIVQIFLHASDDNSKPVQS